MRRGVLALPLLAALSVTAAGTISRADPPGLLVSVDGHVGGTVDTILAWDGAARPGATITGSTAPTHNLVPSVQLAMVEGELRIGAFRTRLAVGAGDGLAALHPTAAGAWYTHLVEATVGLRVPFGRRAFTLDAGLLPGHLGFERWPTRDHWNVSHALLAEAAPFYQLGVRARVDLVPHLTAALLLLGGYAAPETADGHRFLSGGAQIAWTSARVRAAANLFGGPAPTPPGALPSANPYIHVDAWAAIQPIRPIEAAAEIAAGLQLLDESAGARWASWAGLGVWIRYAPIDRLALALRADLLDDRDAGLVTRSAQRLMEATASISLALGPATLRAEARLDRGSAPTLDGQTGRELVLLSAFASF